MRQAIASNPVESARIRIPATTGGTETAAYLPHQYLAVALANLGDCRGARQAWGISLDQGEAQQTPEFAQLSGAARRRCEPTAAARPPSPEPPETVTGEPPPIVEVIRGDKRNHEVIGEIPAAPPVTPPATGGPASGGAAPSIAPTVPEREPEVAPSRNPEERPRPAQEVSPASERPREPAGSPSDVPTFQWLLLGTGVLLLVILLPIAIVVPQPTPFQYLVFRTTLSLAATCVAASIPWLTTASAEFQRAGSAGGAIAVFLLVYFVDPLKRFARTESVPRPPVTAPMPESCIFICYRRANSEDIVGRLHEALVKQFGAAAVFKDVDDVPLGLDFRTVLKGAVGSCRVILAVIGPAWDQLRNEAGLRRIDDPADYVRFEIASALQRGIPVIPVLVRRPAIPPRDQLPPELGELVYRQAIQLRPDPDFDHDVSRLVENLNRLLAVSEPATT